MLLWFEIFWYLSQVLKFDKIGNTIKIGYQTLGNSIPSSCLLKYVAAVDARLSGQGGSHGGHGGSRTNLGGLTGLNPRRNDFSITPVVDDAAVKILKQKGCECHDTSYLNLTTSTAKYVKSYRSSKYICLKEILVIMKCKFCLNLPSF